MNRCEDCEEDDCIVGECNCECHGEGARLK